jgi:ABC-2 type transport system permease protein
MNKIWIIIKREYLTRVKKRTFIIMTILGPILMAGLFIGPAWLSQMEDNEVKTIAVIDSSKIFVGALPETEFIKFKYLKNTRVSDVEKDFAKNGYYALLYIPPIVLSTPLVTLSSNKQPSLAVRMYIASSLKSDIESLKLVKENIDPTVLKSIKTEVKVGVTKLNDDGTREQKSADLQMVLGIVGGMLIYFFIFMYGSQVMRGVIEEKTSRIVEVIVSSVKPFQLMMGKIVGIAMVGITQFVLWIVLTFSIIMVAQSFFFSQSGIQSQFKAESIMKQAGSIEKSDKIDHQVMSDEADMSEVDAAFESIKSIDFGVMIGSFLFFFLAGYLLYSAMFAAIGSAVDSEADTQQFMMPVTIPLILSIVLIGNVTGNPEGPIAFWFSIIPFTSPVVMMMRIPFGVPWHEVVLSVTLLIGSFIVMTWLAAKIYRTGILLYGKKVGYKELFNGLNTEIID